MVVEKLGDSSYSTIYSFQPKRRAPGTVAHDSHMHGHMTCIDRHGNGIKLEPKWYLPLVNLRFHPAEVEGIYTALSSSPPITYCPPTSSLSRLHYVTGIRTSIRQENDVTSLWGQCPWPFHWFHTNVEGGMARLPSKWFVAPGTFSSVSLSCYQWCEPWNRASEE